MTELTIIQTAANARAIADHVLVVLPASRSTLAKRRWRGVAEDGREFGFDLATPLDHGAVFHLDEVHYYQLHQSEEDVIEVPVETLEQAARVAWLLGNLHFPVQVLVEAVRVADDPAVRQLVEREALPHHHLHCVFLPLAAEGHAHHHHE